MSDFVAAEGDSDVATPDLTGAKNEARDIGCLE
jgi:hypothetical protein